MLLDQLTLGIRLLDEATFDNFFLGDNTEVVAAIKALADTARWGFIYIYGNVGVGKSHLLQACCQCVSPQQSAFYLPLGPEFSPAILENLDQYSLVCIDDIETYAGNRVWEEALFHFYNRAIQNQTRLLVAGISLVKQLPFLLPDLASRLSSGLTYILKELTDSQKLAALQLRAAKRGFNLSEEVGCYLLNHYPRDMSALFKLLEQLDQASLEANHRVTVPFVKQIFNKN